MRFSLILKVFFASLAGFAAGPGQAQSGAKPPLVAITAIVEHPALDAVRAGITAELAAQGYKQGESVRITFESAQGSTATAAQIARKIAGDAPAVAVGISTPSAQALAAAAKQVPLVYAAVTDPVAAGLIPAAGTPKEKITGVSDMSPLGDQVALIREILPGAKKLGVLFNPGEANSVALVAALKTVAAKAGFEVIEGPATKTADVQQAARSVLSKADAIYVPTDNTVVSAFEAVAAAGRQARKPVFAGDTASVAKGAVAAVGFDYDTVGRQAGALAARILKGEAPGAIPPEDARGTDLKVNPAAAAAIGLSLPAQVLARAKAL